MFSLTFKKVGKPVAFVRGGKYGGKIISIVENKNFGKVDREIPVAFEKLIKSPLLDKYKTKREKLRKLEKIKRFIRSMTFEPFPPPSFTLGKKKMVIVDEKYFKGFFQKY